MKNMYEKLEELQDILWRNDDMIEQEDLFEAQEKLADLILEVAQEEGKAGRLVNRFPFLYRRVD